MPQAKEQAMETKERSEEIKPRREKGTGTLWKKENGTWMGRVDIGRNAEGKRKYKNFSGKTEAEVKRNGFPESHVCRRHPPAQVSDSCPTLL